jgi:hypothetical protein
VDSRHWYARVTTAAFAAVSAPFVCLPAFWLGLFLAESAGFFLAIIAYGVAGSIGGLMGIGVSRAVLGDDRAYRLSTWGVAVGTGLTTAASLVSADYLHLGDISFRASMAVLGGFAFLGALIGGVRARET